MTEVFKIRQGNSAARENRLWACVHGFAISFDLTRRDTFRPKVHMRTWR
jgi:hypothetical protein